MRPFLLATLMSAFLLFQVEPLVARAILPAFGGTPAVWTCCMLFFQLLLVAGYAYSHFLIARFSPSQQQRLHTFAVALSLLVLGITGLRFGTPLLPPHAARSSLPPQLAILLSLTLAVGAPYFVLATTGPLVQAFWGRTFSTSSPYRLYALSNFGSLLGLVSYPLLVEPLLGLRIQALLWSGGYLLFAICIIVATRRASRGSLVQSPADISTDIYTTHNYIQSIQSPRAGDRLAWTLLAAIASTLLLAVTNQLCQEVAAFPLLWVLPLALYLLSFILAFDAPRWYPRAIWMPLFIASAGCAVWFLRHARQPIEWQIACWSLTLLSGCMVCHGELSRSRPPARFLTSFYLLVAIGGAAGGLFVALIAPQIFSTYDEVQLSLAAVVVTIAIALLIDSKSILRSGPLWRMRLSRPLFGIVCGALLAAIAGTLVFSRSAITISLSRSFFGVLRVTEPFRGDPARERFVLVHGRTFHGLQLTSMEGRRTPTTYYEEGSGIGRAILQNPRWEKGLHIGMCGLGAGTVAAYLRPIDNLRIYEIDPNVIALSASESGPFRFVRDARGPVQVVLGDGRISLEEELARGSNAFDVLAIDAFSGDAIPVHLLTREAFALYMSHLAPDGVLAMHLTNAHLNLVPVVESVAASLGLFSGLVDTEYEQPADSVIWDSTWVLIARTESALAPFGPFDEDDDDSEPVRPWTDDYSNVFGALKL